MYTKDSDKALAPDTGCSTSLSKCPLESGSFLSVGCRGWKLLCECLWTIKKSVLQDQSHYTLIVSTQKEVIRGEEKVAKYFTVGSKISFCSIFNLILHNFC